MTIHARPICRIIGDSCRRRLSLTALSIIVPVVCAGCGNPTVAPVETAAGSGSAPASGGSSGGFTITMAGATLQFSDEWQQSPAIPGNPAVGAMLGRTPQEAMENGATLVVMAPEVPTWSDAAKSMIVLRKQSDSEFMKTEQDEDIQVAGMSGFFQVVRTFGNPKASTDSLREDTLQHKWTLNSGNQILLITGQCRASKASEFAPKLEKVVQTLKHQ